MTSHRPVTAARLGRIMAWLRRRQDRAWSEITRATGEARAAEGRFARARAAHRQLLEMAVERGLLPPVALDL